MARKTGEIKMRRYDYWHKIIESNNPQLKKGLAVALCRKYYKQVNFFNMKTNKNTSIKVIYLGRILRDLPLKEKCILLDKWEKEKDNDRNQD